MALLAAAAGALLMGAAADVAGNACIGTVITIGVGAGGTAVARASSAANNRAPKKVAARLPVATAALSQPYCCLLPVFLVVIVMVLMVVMVVMVVVAFLVAANRTVESGLGRPVGIDLVL